MNWDEYLHLMTDTAHIAFELSWEVITGIIIYPIAKRFWERGKVRAVSRHDAKYHAGEHAHEEAV
jgi:hypothetical protein